MKEITPGLFSAVVKWHEKTHEKSSRIAKHFDLSEYDVKKILDADRTEKVFLAAEKSECQARRKKRQINLLVSLAVVAVLALLVVGAYYFTRVATEDDAVGNLKPLARTYLANRSPVNWYIPKPFDFEQAIAKQDDIQADLDYMLLRHNSLPAVAYQYKKFGGKFMVEFFHRETGGPVYTSKGQTLVADTKPEGTLEVVLFDQLSEGHPVLSSGGFAFYKSDWHAVVIAGMEFSPQWRDALIIHEINHAVFDLEGKSSAHAPMLSDSWISEEVECHDLERAVLDQETNGAYTGELQAIIGLRSARSPVELLASLNEGDLKKLDSLFGSASDREAGLRIAQYINDLTTLWLQQHSSAGQDPQKAKIANYRTNFRLVRRLE